MTDEIRKLLAERDAAEEKLEQTYAAMVAAEAEFVARRQKGSSWVAGFTLLDRRREWVNASNEVKTVAEKLVKAWKGET